MALSKRFRATTLRTLRDLSILGSLCGAFYLLTLFYSSSESDTSEPADSQVAGLQQRAIEEMANRKWDAAADVFQQLTVLDPFDGNAFKRHADCLAQQRYNCATRLEWLRGDTDDPIDTEREQELLEQHKTLTTETIAAYEKLADFARYRGDGYEKLARIYGYKMRIDVDDRESLKEKAFHYLNLLVDEGYCTQRGIRFIGDFASIRNDPSFDEICSKEDEIVENDPYYKSLRGGGGLRMGIVR